jgi:hypothetical protein
MDNTFPVESHHWRKSTGVYAPKGQNPTTNARDNVFADSVASEMANVTGSPTTGYNATFTVGIAV